VAWGARKVPGAPRAFPPLSATSSYVVSVASPGLFSSWLTSVSVYECPAVTAPVTCFHPALRVHVLPSTVAVVPVVLSLSVAMAQS